MSDNANGTNWLRRTLASILSRNPRGDVIAASVDEGARGVAVGKNIIQIGQIVFPTWLLAALLGLIVGGALVAWLVFVPARMSGGFNVAVAEFGVKGADGRVHPATDGKQLSRWVFEALRREYAQTPELQSAVAVQIWHDSLPLTAKRATIGFIADEAAARDLLYRIGADMVIYGYLDGENGFTPQFYLRHDLLRGDTDPAGGNYQLGQPIPLALPINFEDSATKALLGLDLKVRTQALLWLSAGLLYEVIDRPDLALTTFQTAERQLDKVWKDGDGKEILYFFIGREALILSEGATDNTYLDQAQQAFATAIGMKGDYARAHIGMGSVFFRRAEMLAPELRLETNDLDQSIAEYTQARDLAAAASGLAAAASGPAAADSGLAAPGTTIAAIARLGLGLAYRLQGEAYLKQGANSDADAQLQQAIIELEAAAGPLEKADLRRMAAQAYLGLGAAYFQRAFIQSSQQDVVGSKALYTKARDAFAQCIQQDRGTPLDKILKERIVQGECVPNQKMADKALASVQ